MTTEGGESNDRTREDDAKTPPDGGDESNETDREPPQETDADTIGDVDSFDDHVEDVLDAMPDGVFVTDVTSEHVINTNDRAEELLERAGSDIVGAPLRDIFPPTPSYDDITSRLRDLATGRNDPVPVPGIGDGGHIKVMRPDGTTVPVALTVSTAQLAGGVALIAVAKDISDRHTREQRLSVFTRILRHNLRNNLTVVRGYAEALATQADGTDSDIIETLLAKTDELLNLADKARTVEAVVGQESPQVQEVGVTDIVQRTVTEVAPETAAATVEVDASPGITLTTTPKAVEEAILNIIENAVEHADTPAPRAWVSINVLSGGVEVVVEDEGPGLPQHERAVLLRGEETQLEHSSGIGLWLVHWAVSAAEGDVFFEETAQGSRVTLWFPELDG